jgi:RHS repeat-associated protein
LLRPGDPNAVCRGTDARSITATSTYDALNRLTQKSYNDNPQTPTAYFYYDEASYTLNNTPYTLNNTRGRLSRTSAASGTAITLHNYDPAGRIKDQWQCTPYNCSSATIWHSSYTYNLAGDVTSWVNPVSHTFTNTITRAQRISETTSSLSDSTHPATLGTFTYAPHGGIATAVNGCVGQDCVQRQQTYDYNNRLQPVRIQLGRAADNDALYCSVYNYYADYDNPSSCDIPTPPQDGSKRNNGSVQGYWYKDWVNTLSHTASNTYDSLNRLTSSIATGDVTHNLDFSCDRYGNMTCVRDDQTNPISACPVLTFGATTNRLTTSGYTYDAAGNLLTDGTHSYQWDAEGRLKLVDQGGTMDVTYNAFGQQVKEREGWVNAFDAFGQWIGRYNNNTTNWDVKGVTKLDEQMLAVQGSSWTRFVHPNALGSTTMNTDHSGAEGGDALFYPWGQIWMNLHPAEWHFAAFDYRNNADLDPALFRQYNSDYGRWLTPDPVAGDVRDPQSLNLYPYVLNNPTNFTDPLGLDWEPGGPFPPVEPPNPNEACLVGNASLAGVPGMCPDPLAQVCTLDGGPVPCEMAKRLVKIGAAAQCPNNDCWQKRFTAAWDPKEKKVKDVWEIWIPHPALYAEFKYNKKTGHWELIFNYFQGPHWKQFTPAKPDYVYTPPKVTPQKYKWVRPWGPDIGRESSVVFWGVAPGRVSAVPVTPEISIDY